MSLKIALDYDWTYTADPELWNGFIEVAEARGHEVFIVTMRHAIEDRILDVTEIPIYYCDGESKKDVMEAAGIEVSIWIDDHPEGIAHGSSFTPEQLAAWRDNERV